MTMTDTLSTKRFKMRLRQAEYLPDAPVRDKHLPAGAVLSVDEPTALRWYEQKVADPAPPDAETYGEIEERSRRDEFFRIAQPAEGVFDRAITRDGSSAAANARSGPSPMPRRPRGGDGHPNMQEGPRRTRRADLAGVEVANETEYDAARDED